MLRDTREGASREGRCVTSRDAEWRVVSLTMAADSSRPTSVCSGPAGVKLSVAGRR